AWAKSPDSIHRREACLLRNQRNRKRRRCGGWSNDPDSPCDSPRQPMFLRQAFCSLVLLLTPLVSCRGDEPLYSGKPLAFWLDELKSDDPLISEEALAVLSEAGAAARAATPAILKRTHHADPYLRAASLSALKTVAEPKEARQAAIQALKDDHPLVRCRAVLLLAHVDPKHPDILPLTLELLKQPAGRDELLLLLSRMGPQAEPAVPTLTKLLADTDLPTRHSAIQALRQIGPAARPAVPALLEQLQSAD